MASTTTANSLTGELQSMSISNPPTSCQSCNKPASSTSPLKICSKCKSARYCSRECQTADWKRHKQACRASVIASDAQSRTAAAAAAVPEPGKAAVPGSGRASSDWEDVGSSSSDSSGPDDRPSTQQPQPQPQRRSMPAFSSSPSAHWAGLPERTAFEHIIDAYRLRVEDEYAFSANTRGIYNEEAPLPDFRRFLNKAEKARTRLLPPWWSKAKRSECERHALTADWSNIQDAVEKHDISEHYGDPLMPMTLRMWAEMVEGRNVMAC